MTITIATFRADFPEFASVTVYPDAAFDFWKQYAIQVMSVARWGAAASGSDPRTLYDIGMELFIAHNLVLEARAQAEAANSAPPGGSTGPVSGKSVDKVSISYSTADAIEEGGGNLNLTIYGTRYYKLMRMAGAGGFQTGVGCGGINGAYAGPWFCNFPNGSNSG